MFRLLLVCARALAPWRVVASYGVFYPHSSPPLKWALAFEGSNDGKTWKRYPYPYSPTGSRSAPPFVAPWHPRLDHDVFYKALGMNNANFSSNIGTAHPYTLANVTPSQLLCARLVEDDSTVRSLFHDPPFPAGSPPRYARASLRLLVPRASALRGENGMLETEEGAPRLHSYPCAPPTAPAPHRLPRTRTRPPASLLRHALLLWSQAPPGAASPPECAPRRAWRTLTPGGWPGTWACTAGRWRGEGGRRCGTAPSPPTCP